MPNRAAIVTGASSGIGLAIAHMLGEEGHALTVAARRPEKLNAAAEELRGAGYDVHEVVLGGDVFIGVSTNPGASATLLMPSPLSSLFIACV
jgi:NAD(P)-dependent dehydrogenase (short-subunit alcohol dehydrogenase family)